MNSDSALAEAYVYGQLARFETLEGLVRILESLDPPPSSDAFNHSDFERAFRGRVESLLDDYRPLVDSH